VHHGRVLVAMCEHSVSRHRLCHQRIPRRGDFPNPLHAFEGRMPRFATSPSPELNLGGENDLNRIGFVPGNPQYPMGLHWWPLAWRCGRLASLKKVKNPPILRYTHGNCPQHGPALAAATWPHLLGMARMDSSRGKNG